MATPAHDDSKKELLRKLREEPDAWNQWWTSLGPEKRRQSDLWGEDLRGADLKSRKLADVNLSGSNLEDADLSYSDLTHARLPEANMRGARLFHTNLADVNLFKADLREASLQSASFTGAHLIHTKLNNANLRDADLSEIKGPLLASQLAGADLTGAKLPPPLEKLYEKLGSVSDISDSAKKLFLVLLAACLYSWLTIGTTRDVDLVTNRASSPLPVIQTPIPMVGFYIVAPIILLCIYFYFQFYLQKLWEELATLPAVFTDGRPLYVRADPWLFNDLVRGHFARLKKNRPFLSYFQQFISILLAWWLVPITLLLFWGRYLPRHDLSWSIVLALLLAMSIISARQLYRLARETLRGDERIPYAWSNFIKNPKTYTRLLRAVTIATALILTSVGAVHGVRYWDPHIADRYPQKSPSFSRSPQTWIPALMALVRYSPFANLENTDVSVKPPGWTGRDDELDRVSGANLNKANLQYASFMKAFLARAQFEEADLRGARLNRADMRGSDLVHANLTSARLSATLMQRADAYNAVFEGSDLSSANLKGADLTQARMARITAQDACLEGATLRQADLRSADLSSADLTAADLHGADLTEAKLDSAEIKYANLRRARGLSLDQIKKTTGWEMASFDAKINQQLGLPRDHIETLEQQRKSAENQKEGTTKLPSISSTCQ